MAYLACSCGDTLASEIGQLARKHPHIISTFEWAPHGRDGAVSFFGTIMSAIGGGIVGAAYGSMETVLDGAIYGAVGSIFDSWLGVLLQPPSLLNDKPELWRRLNVVVNIGSSVAIAIIAIASANPARHTLTPTTRSVLAILPTHVAIQLTIGTASPVAGEFARIMAGMALMIPCLFHSKGDDELVTIIIAFFSCMGILFWSTLHVKGPMALNGLVLWCLLLMSIIIASFYPQVDGTMSITNIFNEAIHFSQRMLCDLFVVPLILLPVCRIITHIMRGMLVRISNYYQCDTLANEIWISAATGAFMALACAVFALARTLCLDGDVSLFTPCIIYEVIVLCFVAIFVTIKPFTRFRDFIITIVYIFVTITVNKK